MAGRGAWVANTSPRSWPAVAPPAVGSGRPRPQRSGGRHPCDLCV